METSIVDGLVIALIGMIVVFVVLIVLMAVIAIMGLTDKTGKSPEPALAGAGAGTVPTSEPSETAKPQKKLAPGSCGEVGIFAAPDRTAAMIMAVVADKMGAPLNELRFKSIREIGEDTNEV